MSVGVVNAKLASFKAYVRKMKQYEEAISLIYWDMRTGAPKKGIETRSEVVGELSTEVFSDVYVR